MINGMAPRLDIIQMNATIILALFLLHVYFAFNGWIIAKYLSAYYINK